MTKNKTGFFLFYLFLLSFTGTAFPQKIDLNGILEPIITNLRLQYPRAMSRAKLVVDNFDMDPKKETLQITLSKGFENIPYRKENVEALYDDIRGLLPEPLNKYELKIFVANYPVEDLIPNYYLGKGKRDKSRVPPVLPENNPIVKNESKPYKITKGLESKHLAIWHSHGWYYDPMLDLWQWQRARLFQTVEDIYTMSYTLPYLIPMLENAGAHVFVPRERDTQLNEVIVDNDGENASSYQETNGSKAVWEQGSFPGFANPKKIYSESENPFSHGTYRQIKTAKKGDASAEWTPNIPEKGEYAVYVAYQTLPESTRDAHYTVFHSGGKTEFKVNQTMGGGTWIYLGTFNFERGSNPKIGKVQLTNESKENDKILTADAVRFGGGYSNIGRTKIVNKNGQPVAEVQTSGKPRFLEGARYWLQWAGFHDSVYNINENKNDYKDDYMCRGAWVNNLLGGSVKDPNSEGKNIPVDLTLGFHTDAGLYTNDSIFGTLAIYMTDSNQGLFKNKQRRIASRDLSDLIQTQIVEDIQLHFRDDWNRRILTDQSYNEARVPEVPTLLLELLSHQNPSDMKYGLDPNFRFLVSRAIYKGVLKFISSQYGTNYVVQPLPVTHFAVEFMNEREVYLSWKEQPDFQEPTAQAQRYIVYTAKEDGGFDNGVMVNETHAVIPVDPGRIYNFKITAVNEGGESFPSEILSACRMPGKSKTVLIINGFHRVSAPFFFDNGTHAGFLDNVDQGVPDRYDLSYTGSQHIFAKDVPFKTNESPGFGGSHGGYENEVIAGNTFNFPYIHGKAIRNAGYSFVSCSDEVVTPENMNLSKYFAIDLILGEEKETQIGKEKKYKIFKEPIRKVLTAYLESGGNLFASGSYIASDIWMHEECDPDEVEFAERVLRYTWKRERASKTGKVAGFVSEFKTNCSFRTSLSKDQYAAEAPDALEAINYSYPVLMYEENNLPACIGYKSKYCTIIAGFPFEAIIRESNRYEFMKEIMDFFEKKK